MENMSLVDFFDLLNGRLDERVRRLVVAAAAKSLPHGGATAVAKAAGVSRSVIYDGIKELVGSASEAMAEPSSRQRRPGAGPKFLVDKDADLIRDLGKGVSL